MSLLNSKLYLLAKQKAANEGAKPQPRAKSAA
jgi:hypothetical protein